MSRALRALVQRASVRGVLDGSQLGTAVHALLQMDLLDVHSAGMLRCIADGTPSAAPHARVSVLRVLVSATRTQCLPATRLPDMLPQTLQQVQSDLVDVVDALDMSDTVRAMEALVRMLLLADLAPHLQTRLLRELQERCLALVPVAQRSADLLDLLHIALTVCQSPALASSSEVLATATHKEATAPATQDTARLVRSVCDWARVLLARTVAALRRRLDGLTRDELLALVHQLTLPTPTLCSTRRREGQPHQQQPASRALPEATQAVPEACRPLLLAALARARREVDMCSPAQLTEWLQQLRRLPPQPALTMRLVRRMSDPLLLMQQDLSCEQLGVAAGALARMLHDTAPKQAAAHDDAVAAASAATEVVSQAEGADEGVVLRGLVALLRGLVQRVEQLTRHSAEAVAATRQCLLPVLLALPETALLEQWRRHQHAAGASGAAPLPLLSLDELRTAADTLRRGCCLALRVLPQLASQTRVALLTLSLRWPIFAACMPDMPPCMVAHRDDGAGSCTSATEREANARYAFVQLAPLDASEAAAKQTALCRCIEDAIPDLDAAGTLAVLNDLAGVYATTRVSTGRQQHGYQPPRLTASQASVVLARVRRTCDALHARLQRLPRSQLDALSTTQLTRYLQSMSKLGMLSKASYYRVLELLSPRHLTPFELCVVLGVMARQQLVRGGGRVLGQTQRRLSELATALPPTLKAQLLCYWGKLYNNCGNHPALPAPPLLDGFFASAQETSRLGGLGGAFALIGLVELRQYRSPALVWLLHDLRATWAAKTTDTSATAASHEVIEQVRSATYLAELVRSLCRLGPAATADGGSAFDTVLVRALGTLREQLALSPSLFVSLSQLTWHWPLLVWYVETQGSAAVREAWSSLCAVATTLVRTRLRDIARAPRLRRNTFLYNQLAIGVYLDALPPPHEGAELTRLVHHLDTSDMAPMLGNMHQLADAVTVALYVLRPGDERRQLILHFVLQHVGMWSVSDGLRVWGDTTRYERQRERAGGTAATREAGEDDLVCQLRSVVASFVCDEAQAARLSPVEGLLRRELARQA